MGVDFAGLIEEGEGILTHLNEARVVTSAGASAARWPLEFERDEAFDVGCVDQSAGKIGMLGELAAVDLCGFLKVIERPCVLSGAADEAAPSRFDVAKGEDVSGGFELGLRLVKQAQGFSSLAALKEEPRLVDVRDGHQARRAHLDGERLGALNVVKCEIVLSLLAVCAALPKVRDDDEMAIQNIGPNAQDELEDLARFGGFFVEEIEIGLDHAEAEEIVQLHGGAGYGEEWCGQFLEEWDIFVSEIDPLGDAEEQCGRIRGRRIGEMLSQVCVVEQTEAVTHLALDQCVVQAAKDGVSGRYHWVLRVCAAACFRLILVLFFVDEESGF
jgi:hypothetical protein